MAELDPIVAEILLKGDDEFLSSLKKVGDEGASDIAKLAASATEGAGSLQLLSETLHPLELAISGIAAAMIVFIEQQTELTQKTILLAQAFGTTAGQLQELEAVFASSGVKVEQFERFANRLTITIAREWPQIAESIKTYANENDAATVRVSNAILRVQDAQNRLADNSAARAAQMAKDNDAVEAAYIKLQFAAQLAAQEQLGALQAVRGAQLSVAAAEQHLAELEGRPPSAAEKENLALAQARQAVDQARKSEQDALIAQQEKAAEADLKRRQQEQAYDDLRRKAAQNARDDAAQRQKDENAVKEAVVARGEAEQKAADFAKKNISSIRDALNGIVEGNKSAAQQINLTEVSVENLTKAIIAQAAANSKASEPSGYETLRAISELFSKDVDHLITQQQRLAIVNKLSGTSMQALGVSAAEILNVLEHDTEHIKDLANATDEFGKKVPPPSIEAFRGALSNLNLQISILSQRLAVAVAPAFTAFLKAIGDSITDNNGLIHQFVDGLHAIGDAVIAVIRYLDELEEKKVFDEIVTKAAFVKAVLIGIGTAFVYMTGPIGVMVAAIGLVITAVGAVRDHWDDVVKAVEKAWDAVKDNSVIQFFTSVLEIAVKILKVVGDVAKALFGWKPFAAGAAGGQGQGQGQGQGGDQPTIAAEAPISRAGGGPVDGPGTTTSDSIMARLSRGEFVVKAAAVSAYGAGLFHALNNMELPGFASGGLVASPVRMAGGGNVPATSVLNLSIDGKSFNGLRGPKSTIDDLSSFAIARQASSAGTQPSWVK